MVREEGRGSVVAMNMETEGGREGDRQRVRDWKREEMEQQTD